jgi:hypothetical protein
MFLLYNALLCGQKLGIQLGINSSNQVWKNASGIIIDDYKPLTGFNIGLNIELQISRLVAVESGLIFENKGFRRIQDATDFRNNIIYATVPVMVKAGPQVGPVKILGFTGLYLGIAMVALEITRFEEETEVYRLSLGNNKLSDDFRNIDYGTVFGAGIEYNDFSLTFFYSLGLANIYPKSNGDKIRNQSISIHLGYRF